jgi:hypothetical protein
MRACDSCTTRKSARFQVRANLEPLCSPLQAALRFFRILMPAPSSVSLAGRLPRFITAKPWRRIGFTTFPFLPTRMNFSVSIRLAPVSPPAALVATCPYHREEQPATHLLVRACQQLWLIFRHEGYATVHLRCACGNCLAPTPHGCWQCRSLPCHQGGSPFRQVRCPRSFAPDRYQSRTFG